VQKAGLVPAFCFLCSKRSASRHPTQRKRCKM
jgi:hypothetical protein